MIAGRQRFEESPGSMKEGCRVIPGRGNPRESATEKRLPWCRGFAPGVSRAMVKRWGKSPPRVWQQNRLGKPHPEQCRIGASCGLVPDHRPGVPPQGHFSPEARVGSLTALVTGAAEEWSSMGGNPRDRTRLTGHPHAFPKNRYGHKLRIVRCGDPEHDDVGRKHHPALVSERSRDCLGKPVPTFPRHAPAFDLRQRCHLRAGAWSCMVLG